MGGGCLATFFSSSVLLAAGLDVLLPDTSPPGLVSVGGDFEVSPAFPAGDLSVVPDLAAVSPAFPLPALEVSPLGGCDSSCFAGGLPVFDVAESV